MVMRLILVSGLFAAGIELPGACMKKHARGLLVMVVPTMAFGWFMVAGGKFAERHVPESIRV